MLQQCDESLGVNDAMLEQKGITIGEWVLEPALNQIHRDGQTVSLEPLATEVLEYFARHPQKVISPDELIENLWDRQFVGDSPVYRIIAELRRQLGDDARHPKYIETIRKRGYRLLADVTLPEPEPDVPVDTSSPATSSPTPPPAEVTAEPAPATGSARIAWMIVGLVAVAVVAWLQFGRESEDPVKTAVDIPVIAVIPFENLSSNDEDFMVRGLTDAVATRLASVAQLRVISQNSTRQFARSTATSELIGTELGAEYLVTGTALRRTNDDATDWLRVNAHLVAVATDSYLWSQTYEQPITDIIDVQASIAERVAQQLDVALLEPERLGRLESAAPSLETYGRYLKGREALSRGWDEPDLQEAVTEFEAAIADDPSFAPAYASLGLAHLQLYAQYWDRSDERLELAREMVDKSLELDANLIDGQFGLGSYYLRRDMLQPALQHLNFVRQNQPSHTEALAAIAQVHQRTGNLREATAALVASAQFDPLNHRLLYLLGQTQIVAGAHADAESSLERAISMRPELIEGYLFKAVNYMSWRGDEANAAQEFERAAEKLGMDNVMTWLLQLGISSSFRFAGPKFRQALSEWELEGSDADPTAYYLAMAEISEISGDSETAKENYEKARANLEKLVEQAPDEPFYYAVLGSAYAGAGLPEKAIATGKKLLQLAPVDDNQWDNADFLWYMAEIYVLSGRYEEAMDQVEIALQYPTTLTRAWIEAEPFWDSLRDEPRFRKIVGLPVMAE